VQTLALKLAGATWLILGAPGKCKYAHPVVNSKRKAVVLVDPFEVSNGPNATDAEPHTWPLSAMTSPLWVGPTR
jgi:hypothetical protein